MRVIVQRVGEASVEIEKKIKGSIKKGFLILLGIEGEDQEEDVVWLCRKIVGMRIFSDQEEAMNLSLKDIDGEVLLISQFTLHASTKKGNRPSFMKAAKPAIAEPLYEQFIQELRNQMGKSIETGTFGAVMKVSLVNDGPVTIFIDSKERE